MGNESKTFSKNRYRTRYELFLSRTVAMTIQYWQYVLVPYFLC